jgi:ferredoxin
MKKVAIPNRNVCVACGACAKSCPREAITVYSGCFAVVNEDKCVGCGLCAKVCPAGCISMRERYEMQ